MQFAKLLRRAGVPILCISIAAAAVSCGGDGQNTQDTAEEARLLRQSGNYVQAVILFEEAVAHGDSQPQLLFDYASTAVLAAQAERSTLYRQKAREAIQLLMDNAGDIDPREIGELWRRLGWEMVRNTDSLQAFQCFDLALEEDVQDIFEDEWLMRGIYAGGHLETLTEIPDSLAGTSSADSILSLAAEVFLVELDRIPRTRTDLREDILRAKASLLPYTDRRDDELAVLTELDRLGGIEPDDRLRRINLLLEAAADDMDDNMLISAREKLLEVWNSNFSGERIRAAYLLGLLEEGSGDIDGALSWYRRACAVSPGSASQAAQMAAARRDSLTYGVTDHRENVPSRVDGAN